VTVVWTPTGGDAATLVDDGAKLFGQIGQLGGQALEQVSPLFRAANPARFMRGNVAGECAFVASKSHASVATAATWWATEYARLNQKGVLVITIGAVTLTMGNATLRAVTRAEWIGVRLSVAYSFGITTIELPGTD
jgi:hypothetical protein